MIQKSCILARNESGERVIQITFPYDLDTLFQIQSLPGRKFHPEQECWSSPLFSESINKLQKWGFAIDNKINIHFSELQNKREKITEETIPGLKGTLRQFQKECVAVIEEKNGRILIADEMGLGKTIQSIAWLQLHPEKRPVVIVVPANLKLNWQKECNNWMTNPKTQILQTTTPSKIIGEIVIINYDILFAWVKELIIIKPQILICDESQYFKSSSTKRTKAIKKLGKDIPHVICLSGTPVMNKPLEIYNALKLIDENLFPHFINFVRTYCNPKWNGYGWDYSGASNTNKLHDILSSTVMLRRLKKDVLKELPDKTFSYVPIELDNNKEYQNAENDFIAWVRANKGEEAAQKISKVEQLAKVEGLKQIAVKGKMKQAKEWISDFLESGEKLVVFCVHKFVVDELMAEFKDIAVKIDGSVGNMNKRQKAKDDFQNNPNVRLFIGSDAASEGITLTAASNLVHLELNWSPSKLDQKTDRVHRITQTKGVIVYYLLAAGTIEEKIAKLIDRKRRIVDSVMDGKETEQENLLHELMLLYK